ncbi:hypothetical protein GCM10025794_19380 [Massilia kyonggiensis]|nr:hypothetical protein [Massilia kyonggiensis]
MSAAGRSTPPETRSCSLGKNRPYPARAIQRLHFNSTANKVGYGDNAEPLLQKFIARTPDVVEKVRSELPDGFTAAVADKVLDGVLAAAHALEAMPPS